MDTREIIKNNPLVDIDNYSNKMSISKVVKYFERQGIFFTKTMIQNYVRVGVLPTPEDKRWYTKKHMIALYLVNELKVVFSLDDLRRVIIPLFEKDDNFDYMTYLNEFLNFYNETIESESNKLDELTYSVGNDTELGILLHMAKTVANNNIILDRL